MEEKKKNKFAEIPKILNDSWAVNLNKDGVAQEANDDWVQQMRSGQYDDDTFRYVEDGEGGLGCPYSCDCRVGYWESEYLTKLILNGTLDGDNLEQVKEKLKEFAFLDADALEKFKAEVDKESKENPVNVPEINEKTPGSYPIFVTSGEGTQIYNQEPLGASISFEAGNLRFLKGDKDGKEGST